MVESSDPDDVEVMGVGESESQEILVRREGGLAWITFNRPAARNAMTWSMYDRLERLCDEVDTDDGVRVVILTGAGEEAFVAGTDISQFTAFHLPQHALDYERRIDRVLDRLERVSKPAIAMIRGHCVGGGAALALACDLRYAGADLRFGFPIARTIGNCLSMGNYARLTDAVGPARAKEIVMQARTLTAPEAQAWGVVNEVLPVDRLEARVRTVAEELTYLAPVTLRVTKEAIRRLQAARRLGQGEGDDLIVSAYMSEDFRNAVQAFLEKRPVVWKGR